MLKRASNVLFGGRYCCLAFPPSIAFAGRAPPCSVVAGGAFFVVGGGRGKKERRRRGVEFRILNRLSHFSLATRPQSIGPSLRRRRRPLLHQQHQQQVFALLTHRRLSRPIDKLPNHSGGGGVGWSIKIPSDGCGVIFATAFAHVRAGGRGARVLPPIFLPRLLVGGADPPRLNPLSKQARLRRHF